MQIRVRLQCQPLSEDKFRPVIVDNYYINHHFWFELDHVQTSKLTSLLASLAIGPGPSTYMPQNTMMWRTVSRSLPSQETSVESEAFEKLQSEIEHFTLSSHKSDSTEMTSLDADGNIQQLDSHMVAKGAEQDEESYIYMKLKELTLNRESQDPSLLNTAKDIPDMNNMNFAEKGSQEASTGLEKKEESPPFEYQLIVSQVIEDVG